MKTTDGGSNWFIQNIVPGFYGYILNSVHFKDADTGYVVGAVGSYGLYYKTTNGGTSWILMPSCYMYTFQPLRSVFYASANTAIAVGDCGTILKTTTGNPAIVKEIKENENSVTIFPNPTNSSFTIKVPPNIKYICIYNSLGQIVEKRKVNNQTELNFEIKENGIYFVQIATDKEIITKKVIVCNN